MKKIFTLFVLLAMSGCLFVSCGTTNEDIPQNPLKGTLWAEEDDFPIYVEFTGDNTIHLWGVYAKECFGTYIIKPENIIHTQYPGRVMDISLESMTVYEHDGSKHIQRYYMGVFTDNTMVILYEILFYDNNNMVKAQYSKTLTLYKR